MSLWRLFGSHVWLKPHSRLCRVSQRGEGVGTGLCEGQISIDVPSSMTVTMKKKRYRMMASEDYLKQEMKYESSMRQNGPGCHRISVQTT